MPKNRSKSGETRLEILEYVAIHGSANKWELAQKLKKSYSVIYGNIKKMLMHNFLEIAKSEPSKKNPKITTDYYDVTLGGIVDLLNYQKPWNHIDKIAQIQKDKLPLIFGKWDFFKKKRMIQVIIDRLKKVVRLYRSRFGRKLLSILVRGDLNDFKIKAMREFGEEEGKAILARHRFIAPSLTDRVLGIDPQEIFLESTLRAPSQKKSIETSIEDPDFKQYYELTLKRPTLKQFIENVVNDPDLKQYYDEWFEEWERRYAKDYNNFRELKNWFENVRSQS